jgi:hypothetical protein
MQLAYSPADLFEMFAHAVPERIAIVFGELRVTYLQLAERANQLAARLQRHGVGPGDTEVIAAPHRRNRILRHLLILSTFPLLLTSAPAISKEATPLSGEALYGDVIRYAALGEHRTGGEGDLATAVWLGRELEAAGIESSHQTFRFTRFLAQEATIEVGGKAIAGLPFWFPHVTPAQGTRGVLVRMDADAPLKGAIALADAATAGVWHQVDVPTLARRAAAAGALGLVVAFDHPSGEHYQPNAVEGLEQTPLPIPTLVVSGGEGERLRESVGSDAVLTITGERIPDSPAFNVFGRIVRGGGKWIVVSTPLSGWFQAAGERGPGGIALWLGLARWAAATPGDQNFLFVATSGHELHYLGAKAAIGAHRVPPPQEVAFWLHLGASIGTRAWAARDDQLVSLNHEPPGKFFFAHPGAMSAARAAFALLPELGLQSVSSLPDSAGGELAVFRNAGYPVAGIVGAHRFFHTPRDLPDVTGPDLLAPYGAAMRDLLLNVAGTR